MGILAHVDAGKTTLSEALLYCSGAVRKLGRVDHQNAFLDTDSLERERGITIFSKQARLTWEDTELQLLDTPGHVDFSAEAERTLQVLDCAVLVISGSDGVQGHTRTLWRLLETYGVPVFVFVNKMDLAGTDRMALLAELKSRGVKLAVYSNKGDRFCGEIVEHFFPGIFDVIRGKVDGVPVKPDPAGLALVMNALGAETATTLYVGDSNVDMETAKNGNLVSCGVTWGFRGRRELEEAGAVHLADTAEELQALILRP